MSQLLYSASELFTAKVPKATNSYAPMPHKVVDQITREVLDKAGFSVKHSNFTGSRFGKQAIGRYTIVSGDDPEMGIQIAWNNSYDKSIPLKWAIGAEVFICGNGVIHGDMGIFKRKHTGTVHDEYKSAVGMYVDKAGELFGNLIKDKEQFKEIEVTKRTVAELVGRMHLENDIITATQVGIIKKEIENPSHDYKAGGSLWELYNHTTFALKESHPQFYITQHMNVHNFFKEYSK